MQGIIYILINPRMPGLLKIGMTTRTAEERASEISNGTGIPTRYEVAYEEMVADCEAAERIIHQRLDDYRYNKNREFFELPLKQAIRVFITVAEEVQTAVQIAAQKAQVERAAEMKLANHTFLNGSKSNRHEINSVQSVEINCSRCSTRYMVTLKRGERVASCPTCSNISVPNVPW